MQEDNQVNRVPDWNTALRYLVLALGIVFIIVYIALVFFRIRYPFELEWMEGGSVDHVRRILAAERLYVRPSLEFVPFVYPPLYYYVSALVSLFTGVGFLPLRLVSFIASLGCLVVIFQFVKRETGSAFSGILASGLFAATFRISGAWFDIARVDSLFLFFFLAGLYTIRFRVSPKSYVLAGVLFSLSFLTKQIAFVIFVPIAFYCILYNWRTSIFLIGTIVATIAASTFVLDGIHDGWYSYYVFDLVREHAIETRGLLNFWTRDLIAPLAIACATATFYILARLLHPARHGHPVRSCGSVAPADLMDRDVSVRRADHATLFYSLMAVGMIGGAWLSRLHSGGYDNVLFPAYAAVSILFGLGIHTVLESIRTFPVAGQRLVELFVFLVCIGQFVSLAYNPFHQIPTRRDLEAGRTFVTTVAQIEGEVFVPFHSYLPALAGKASHAHGMAVSDILRGDDGAIRAQLIEDMRQTIRERRFAALILDDTFFSWFLKDILPELSRDIEENYVRRQPVFDSDTPFWPVTGMRTRPEFIYVPRGSDFYSWPR